MENISPFSSSPPSLKTMDPVGLTAFPDCDLLFRDIPVAQGQKSRFSRCGARLRLRKPESLARTWALL